MKIDKSKLRRFGRLSVIVQILSHTPAWVFVLFFVLLVFGLMQTRTRKVRRIPALLLPAGMIALSLAGIMAIFFAKYVYAVMRAFDAGVISTPLFVVALSSVYGLLSGYFGARALNLLEQARVQKA